MRILNILFVSLFLLSCKEQPKKELKAAAESVTAPEFNEDSAYNYIKKQLEFGPRVPATKAHQSCGDFLVDFLKSYADTVIEQKTTAKLYTGKEIAVRNIIASFNPSDTARMLLCAHWDTRPYADNDSLKPTLPNLGANDGASGVAVLMEIARQLKTKGIKKGVDIIFFDVEDWGKIGEAESYCLGSQHWSLHPHKENYQARFGILLDMVGGKEAQFALEANSERYAKEFMHEVWRGAHDLGHANYFVFLPRPGLIDDHYYINRNMNIPTIDIIEFDFDGNMGFPDYWHTHKDNLDAIDKKTLKAVGETVMYVISRY